MAIFFSNLTVGISPIGLVIGQTRDSNCLTKQENYEKLIGYMEINFRHVYPLLDPGNVLGSG